MNLGPIYSTIPAHIRTMSSKLGYLSLLLILMQSHSAVFGKLVFEGAIQSRIYVSDRFVRIYLPPSYESQPRKRYPVLYVHDGQNAFSTVGPNVAFGWGNWELDKTVDRLVSEGKMQEIIMVAVDANRSRYADYKGPMTNAVPGTNKTNSTAFYEKYKRFLTEELKPKIDREFRTKPKAASTGLLGSSMGGICSLALAWENPEVFGLCASMSGAFQIEKQFFLLNILKPYKGTKKPIRVYLDSGIVDYSGGDDGKSNTDAVAAELLRIGWKEGEDLQHFVESKPLEEKELAGYNLGEGKRKEARTSQHNEFYWKVRAWRPLTFMFPPR